MPGSFPTNLHTGVRSEILADYLFTGWGAVTPVRLQDDHGVDLYGGLAESRGGRSVITDYYVVQVKSNSDPWIFEDQESVRWLIEYPLPLFLSCVDKTAGTLAVYHVTPRFYLASMGLLPPRLELVPGEGSEGQFLRWEDGGQRFSLSAPILRVCLSDFLAPENLARMRDVFAHWVRVERDNLNLLSMGLLRFRMPAKYETNRLPRHGISELGTIRPDPEHLQRGMITLAEVVECLGGQLAELGDPRAGVLAALLVHHVLQKHQSYFAAHYRWNSGLPGGWSFASCFSTE